MSKALAKKGPEGQLSTAIRRKRGMEDFDMSKLKLPFLHLCQDMSDAVKSKNAEEGDIINLASGKNYGKSIEVIPLFQQSQRIKWIPFKEGGGMDCVARDAKFGSRHGLCSSCKFRNNWSENNKGQIVPPDCSEYDNFVVLVKGEKMPSILVMGKTKQTAAVKLGNMLLMNEDADIWHSSYVLKTGERREGTQSWYVYEAPRLGKATSETERDTCEKLFTALWQRKSEIAEDTVSRVAAAEGAEEAPADRTAPRKNGVRPGKGRFA
jgi:hypothetical protein